MPTPSGLAVASTVLLIRGITPVVTSSLLGALMESMVVLMSVPYATLLAVAASTSDTGAGSPGPCG
jgi:hypothetical protein